MNIRCVGDAPAVFFPSPRRAATHKLTSRFSSPRLARALTRNCRPRHERRDERGPSSTARRAAAIALPTPLSTPEEAALGAALVRLDVRLYGAPWCDKCREQKQMLFRMLGPRRWRDRYVDCASAQCCLGCAGVGSVPMWKVDGRRYQGRMDPQTLAATVATRARATSVAGDGDGDGDGKHGDGDGDGKPGKLGVVRPGDLPVRGRNRRHTRRSGWAKRAAVRLATDRNAGRYWCEFGELMTPAMAARFGGEKTPAEVGREMAEGDGAEA